MRQNQMTSNGLFGLAMSDWFMLLAGCFAAIALAFLLVLTDTSATCCLE
jgi:hypothetical protein